MQPGCRHGEIGVQPARVGHFSVAASAIGFNDRTISVHQGAGGQT
jgi:hypothetical protein